MAQKLCFLLHACVFLVSNMFCKYVLRKHSSLMNQIGSPYKVKYTVDLARVAEEDHPGTSQTSPKDMNTLLHPARHELGRVSMTSVRIKRPFVLKRIL